MRDCSVVLMLMCLPSAVAVRLRPAALPAGTAAAAAVASATAVLATAAAVAAEPGIDAESLLSSASDAYLKYLASPGFELNRDLVMDDTGQLLSPISGAKINPVLALGAAVTRCGGILPDEAPFNLVQQLLRAVLPKGIIPDYADEDFRKQFQGKWYGTDDDVQLPFGLGVQADREVEKEEKAGGDSGATREES